jgi:hypothetical protein
MTKFSIYEKQNDMKLIKFLKKLFGKPEKKQQLNLAGNVTYLTTEILNLRLLLHMIYHHW